MSTSRHPYWIAPASVLGSVAYGLLASTWRLERHDDPEYTAAVQRGERFVYAFWHARILSVAWWHRGEGIAVLVSRHHDGELVTRLIQRLGYVTGRGSSTRGAEVGLREMLTWARSDRHLALTPDGPRGPAGVLKDGALYLASRLGRPIVPLAAASARAWTTRSWDRHRLPKPFARVVLRHGAPISLPTTLDDAAVSRLRTEVQDALTRCTSEASRLAGESA